MTDKEKTYSHMRKEFYEIYRNKIVPTVKKYKFIRVKELKETIFISVLLMFIGIIILFFAYKCSHRTDTSLVGVWGLLCCLYSIGMIFRFKKCFENKIKNNIMNEICKCFGNLEWSGNSYKNGNIFADSNVIPNFKSEYYDDVFQGYYKDVTIDIVEASYSDKGNVFKGVIVKLDMNKHFTGHTVIKPSGLMHTSPSEELHRTELEDVEFNKKFDVFTNDEVDARYLITPSFMERLKNMKTAFLASSVSCAFYGNLLIIALPTNKDLFSICSLDKPIDDSKQYFQMYEEIVSIIKLIDHFKLNQKIGL